MPRQNFRLPKGVGRQRSPIGQSALELQSCGPLQEGSQLDCAFPPPNDRQHAWPFGQLLLPVHDNPRPPAHCPVGTHISEPPPPIMSMAQHSCVVGSQLIWPQGMG